LVTPIEMPQAGSGPMNRCSDPIHMLLWKKFSALFLCHSMAQYGR
jgi:hypothetical protein